MISSISKLLRPHYCSFYFYFFKGAAADRVYITHSGLDDNYLEPLNRHVLSWMVSDEMGPKIAVLHPPSSIKTLNFLIKSHLIILTKSNPSCPACYCYFPVIFFQYQVDSLPGLILDPIRVQLSDFYNPKWYPYIYLLLTPATPSNPLDHISPSLSLSCL